MGFSYLNNQLVCANSLNVGSLCKKYGPSFYLYDLSDIKERVRWFKKNFSPATHIHYALKANSNPEILQTLAASGVGADVVSGGELIQALGHGIAAQKIVFSGIGKSVAELNLAIDKKIAQINVESVPEIKRLSELARSRGAPVNIALRINPNIQADTHKHISTGLATDKFGIDEADLPAALEVLRQSKEITLNGLAVHIGSQILNPDPIFSAAEKMCSLIQNLRREKWPVRSLDMGGGLGIDYSSSDAEADQKRLEKYAQGLQAVLNKQDLELRLEPGRFLVARAGVLVTQIEYVKVTPQKKFVICSSGMNHLLRPALYEAKHRIQAVNLRSGGEENFAVVGPICESSDILADDCRLSSIAEGDYLAIFDAGAYGFSMASTYNMRALPPEVVVDGEKVKVSQ